jgi:hypothetical protein
MRADPRPPGSTLISLSEFQLPFWMESSICDRRVLIVISSNDKKPTQELPLSPGGKGVRFSRLGIGRGDHVILHHESELAPPVSWEQTTEARLIFALAHWCGLCMDNVG